MKKLIVFALALAVLAPLTLHAEGTIRGTLAGTLASTGGGGGSCGSSFEVCSTFGDLTGWTQSSGTWTADGVLHKTAGGDQMLLYSTALTHQYRQYVIMKITYWSTSTGNYPYIGPLIGSSAGSGLAFAAYFFSGGNPCVGWHYFNGTAYGGSLGGPGSVSPLPGTDIYVATEKQGDPGASTTFRTWTWSTNPGERANWGTPDIEGTGDPGITVSGSHVGIVASTDTDDMVRIDDFKAGSSASAP